MKKGGGINGRGGTRRDININLFVAERIKQKENVSRRAKKR